MCVGKQGVCGVMLAIVAGSAVAADSSVTLYGVADTYLQYLDNGGAHTIGEASGGSTGSLVGMKGNEDLGGGLTAQFDVETGFNLNNGSLLVDKSALFYRQAWVGIKDDKYGSLTLGRQYDAAFRVVYPVEPFNVNEVLSPFSAMVLAVDRKTLSTQYDPGRLSNSVLYQTPRIGGLQGYAMYSFAATVTAPVPATTGNTLGLGVNYRALCGACVYEPAPGDRNHHRPTRRADTARNGAFHRCAGVPVWHRQSAVQLLVSARGRSVTAHARSDSRHRTFAQHRRTRCDHPGHRR
jgi:general bacterial porin, GBP family